MPEICPQIGRSLSISDQVTQDTSRINTSTRALSDAAVKIGEVVSMIDSIRSHTEAVANDIRRLSTTASELHQIGVGGATAVAQQAAVSQVITRISDDIRANGDRVEGVNSKARNVPENTRVLGCEVKGCLGSVRAA